MTSVPAPVPQQLLSVEEGLTTRQKFVIGAGVFALLTIAAYLPTLRNKFIWDDDDYVTNNLTLRTFRGIGRIWLKPMETPQYYPVVHTTFWMEYRVWQLSPVGFHAVNMLLHAGTAVLLWAVFRRLGIPGAWVAAAIFALHPVQVESVAWVTQRKNVLSGGFFLAAMLAYFRFSPPEELEPPKKKSFLRRREEPQWYVLSAVLFGLALMSKTVTCSFPAAMLIVFWWKRGRIKKRDVIPLIPFFIMGLAAGMFTVYLEKVHVGAEGPEWDLSFAQRLIVAGGAICSYFWKLLVPYPLVFIYRRWNVDASIWWQWSGIVAVVTVVAALWALRKRIGRAPLAAALLYIGMLFPALSFFDVYPMRFSFVADHFQYHASMPLIGFLVGAVALSRPSGLSLRVEDKRRIAVAAAVVIMIAYVAIDWRRERDYEDNWTIWTDTIKKNPRCWVAYNNRADMRIKRSDIGGAVGDYQEALKLYPQYAMAHANLGSMLFREGDAKNALIHTAKALELRPDMAQAHLSMGKMLVKTDHLQEGFDHLAEAVRLQPGYADAHLVWGELLAEHGQYWQAIDHYDAALKLNPEFVEAHNRRGESLEKVGKQEQADEEFRKALEINPDYAPARRNLMGISF